MILYRIAIACTVFTMIFADGFVGHHPKPYSFGYTVKDKHGEKHREESGDPGHSVKGTYSFKDDRGVHRQVDYVADKAGFRAEVKTNEPGTANQDPADVKFHSSAHDHRSVYGGFGGSGYGIGGSGGPGYGVGGSGGPGYVVGGYGEPGYGSKGFEGPGYGPKGFGGHGYGYGGFGGHGKHGHFGGHGY